MISRLRYTHNQASRIRRGVSLLALLIGSALVITAFAQGPSKVASQERLGLRLFNDARFSSPQGDLQNSCASCHLFDEDPQGIRAHADFFSRSWVPWRTGDPRREELRNSPTILDAALMPKLHFDGEFGSLEDLVKGTIAGRPMGWLPDEQEAAFDHIYRVILKDQGGEADSYRSEFKSAFGVDPASLDKVRTVELITQAISSYMRTLKSERTSPYDRFVQANGLDAGPAPGENSTAFSLRLLEKIDALEKNKTLKLARGFDGQALEGLRVFYRASGKSSVGNCSACHTPPLFTDLSFHNMGISQSEYDLVNGEGSFASLEIPSASQARRPAVQFRETPSRQKPGCVDLGHWNFVDLKKSSLRRPREDDDQFLKRMIATFKTPTLRNLSYSSPYMHTGSFSTVESALEELSRLSRMARAGKVREGDEELSKIILSEADIDRLTTFLQTLNEDLKKKN